MKNPQASRPNRTVVLVDLENVLTLNPHRCDIAALRNTLDGIRGPDVLIEFASSHWFAKKHMFDFPFGRWQLRSGKNGADNALLDVAAYEDLANRFDSVVLLSGDNAFTGAVSALASRGVSTTVIALRGHLSKRLQLACHTHLLWDLPSQILDLNGRDFGDAA